MRALQKPRDARYGSAGEFLSEARDCHTTLTRPVPTPAASPSLWQMLMAPGVAGPLLLVLLVAGLGGFWFWNRGADARSAREEAIPEIMRLIEEDNYVAAFALAEDAERHIPDDPILTDLWPQMSATGSLDTEPSGADVYIRNYGANDEEWRYLGETPLADLRLPLGVFQWQIEKEGFETLTLAASNPSSLLRNLDEVYDKLPETFVTTPEISLMEAGGTPPGMTLVPGGTTALNGRPLAPVTLGAFFVDTHEVTNEEFKEFLDSGGYERREYWEELEFTRDGQQLSWEEAVAEFQDLSGRPGPATWELSDYPDGQADYPVTGVSWYEAAAYATFRGKSLPTVRHWRRAALSHTELGTPLGPSAAGLSNFDGTAPARVGSYKGMGPYGTFDMGGNVREWCSTRSGDHRWILGGAWNDPEYTITLPYSLPPFDRSPENGFRTVQYLEAESVPDNIARTVGRDPETLEPVSDEVFQALIQQFAYGRSDLNAEIESRDESSDDYIRERITFDGPYDERVPASLFLPKDVDPPYQVVTYFSGAGPFLATGSSRDLAPGESGLFDFVVKSGRALMWPIYDGSFERWSGGTGVLSGVDRDSALRERIIHWRQDLGRSIDYLETRDDIDADKLAYLGFSIGASGAALALLALDDRLQAAVLYSGGLGASASLPPVADSVNYLPRVEILVLMLNGRYDYFYWETSQAQLFDLLGTRGEHKQRITYDAGHAGLPRNQVFG